MHVPHDQAETWDADMTAHALGAGRIYTSWAGNRVGNKSEVRFPLHEIRQA